MAETSRRRQTAKHRAGRLPGRALVIALCVGAGALTLSGAALLADPQPAAIDGPVAGVSSPLVDDSGDAARTPARTPAPEQTRPDPSSGQSFLTADGEMRAGTTGRKVDYRVEVERGLGIDTETFADEVDRTLADRRGWTTQAFRFHRTSNASLRVVLASPATADRLCAPLQTNGEVSCRNGDDVVINARRWGEGVDHIANLRQYRRYLVNHEVGHALGFGHEPCPGPDAPAPVMLQQTLDLEGCRANPWP
ncbi:DUF3152 domain-containing protein [Aeromicrobium sp. CTD01-1L150]|uniref:DUF3152 domain-containing protein n=1 Tax=Aeromicrobium sp. CTD01-1L150 TaxID=3341830 RepID=UPI0035BF50BA